LPKLLDNKNIVGINAEENEKGKSISIFEKIVGLIIFTGMASSENQVLQPNYSTKDVIKYFRHKYNKILQK
jgi:hypothetical protein